MIYLSASAIKDFIQCRKRYFYRRYHSEESVQTDAMVVGSIVHNVIENAWQTKETAEQFLEQEYTKYNVTNVTKLKVKKLVGNFFTKFRGLVGEKDLIEHFFKVKYSDDVMLVGKFDRVLPGHVVIDWKTGGYLPQSIDTDPQFILYHYAYNIENGVYPNNVLYASLSNGSMRAFKVDDLYYKTLLNEIIPDMLTCIKTNSYPRDGMYKQFYNDINCKHCSFRDFCFKQLREEV